MVPNLTGRPSGRSQGPRRQTARRRILVTGGAGFIGSHLVESLVEADHQVVCLDNLSAGREKNLERCVGRENFTLVRGDITDPSTFGDAFTGLDTVFHLAAVSVVKVGPAGTRPYLDQNVMGTYNVLDAISKAGGVDSFVFASTSTVYGEAESIPTDESYGPCMPISLYGASKLACEGLVSAYAHSTGFRASLCRLANVVGPRGGHGVVHDFIRKLESNPRVLKVLGDGQQRKSYLHVSDCVSALTLASERGGPKVEIFNVGSEDSLTSRQIADVVTREMKLEGTSYEFDRRYGGRGWPGDVTEMQLSTQSLRRLGWVPRHRSDEAVRLTVRETVGMLA